MLFAVMIILWMGMCSCPCSVSTESEKDIRSRSLDVEERKRSLNVFSVPENYPSPRDCGTPIFSKESSLMRKPYVQTVLARSARIIWTTKSVKNMKQKTGWLRYRRLGTNKWHLKQSTRQFFSKKKTSWLDQYQMEAIIDGLQPDSVYCYEVLEQDLVVAKNMGWKTSWEAGTKQKAPVRILAFGDSGTGSRSQRELATVFTTKDYDVFLHLGDIAYPNGTYRELEDHMFQPYQHLLYRVPFFPTIGNHDLRSFPGDPARPYMDVYSLPEHSVRESDLERYYSFDHGHVHFVSLDSNPQMLLSVTLGSWDKEKDDMLEWLRQDLSASRLEWKIAFFHHPPYSSATGRPPNRLLRKLVVPILERGGVDLVLSGHDHHYERTHPILRGNVSDSSSAITYIIAGGGGAALRHDVVPNAWHAVSEDSKHSFVEIHIMGCKGLIKAIDIDNTIIDEAIIDGCP